MSYFLHEKPLHTLLSRVAANFFILQLHNWAPTFQKCFGVYIDARLLLVLVIQADFLPVSEAPPAEGVQLRGITTLWFYFALHLSFQARPVVFAVGLQNRLLLFFLTGGRKEAMREKGDEKLRLCHTTLFPPNVCHTT